MTQKRKASLRKLGIMKVMVIVAVLVFIGIIGTSVCRLHHSLKSVSTAVADTKVIVKGKPANRNTDPYAGWKTATLKDEKATFEYPSSWKLITDSSWVQSDTPGIPAPWADTARVTSPTGLMIFISTGDEVFHNQLPDPTILASQPISTLGKNYDLDFFTYGTGISPASVDEACVTASSSGTHFGLISSKTLIQAAGEPGAPAQDAIRIELATKHSGPRDWTVANYEHDSSFHDAKLIIESLTYQD